LREVVGIRELGKIFTGRPTRGKPGQSIGPPADTVAWQVASEERVTIKLTALINKADMYNLHTSIMNSCTANFIYASSRQNSSKYLETKHLKSSVDSDNISIPIIASA
jgi:hypothetical protein